VGGKYACANQYASDHIWLIYGTSILDGNAPVGRDHLKIGQRILRLYHIPCLNHQLCGAQFFQAGCIEFLDQLAFVDDPNSICQLYSSYAEFLTETTEKFCIRLNVSIRETEALLQSGGEKLDEDQNKSLKTLETDARQLLDLAKNIGALSNDKNG
jgi:hypothetical protein